MADEVYVSRERGPEPVAKMNPLHARRAAQLVRQGQRPASASTRSEKHETGSPSIPAHDRDQTRGRSSRRRRAGVGLNMGRDVQAEAT
jgi:hypothetical protein